MKCKECRRKLKTHFYLIGGREFCKFCAMEFISDIKDFKIELNTGGKR